MVLVIIIMVAWLVILGPNLLKRRSRTVGGISSISHFHRQLRVLEHSGPEPLVTPAYRLRSIDGSTVSLQGADGTGVQVAPKLSVVGANQLPRPALAFLGEDPVLSEPTDPGVGTDPVSFPTGSAGRGSPAVADPSTPAPPESTYQPSDAHDRTQARRRRRDTLGVLALVFVTTLMIGCIPGASTVWALTLVSGLALVAYVALLVRMRQMAEERERKLHYLQPRPDIRVEDRALPDSDAGYGTPYGVTDLPVRVSGRYAHPSNQAVAAR
jgi:hypothetical protein